MQYFIDFYVDIKLLVVKGLRWRRKWLDVVSETIRPTSCPADIEELLLE